MTKESEFVPLFQEGSLLQLPIGFYDMVFEIALDFFNAFGTIIFRYVV